MQKMKRTHNGRARDGTQASLDISSYFQYVDLADPTDNQVSPTDVKSSDKNPVTLTIKIEPENATVGQVQLHPSYSDSSKDGSNITPGRLPASKPSNPSGVNVNCTQHSTAHQSAAMTSTSNEASVNQIQPQQCLCVECPLHKDIAMGFEKIMQELNCISLQMWQITADLAKVTKALEGVDLAHNRGAALDPAQSLFKKFKFPLHEEQELEEVIERYLANEHDFKTAVEEVSKIGGNGPYDFIKRTLQLLMDNELASKYSWYGAKKKNVFGKLKIADMLIRAGRTCNPGYTNKDFEEAIKKWLRRAKERSDLERSRMQNATGDRQPPNDPADNTT